MDVDAADMPGHTHHAHHAHDAPMSDAYPSLVIRNVHLPFEADSPTLADPLYNVYCVGSRVDRVELATANGSRSVSSGSGHNSPARPPDYHPSSAGNGTAAGRDSPHAELDAQGRGILLPAFVRLSIPPSPFLALTEISRLPTASATRTSISTSVSSSISATSSSQGASPRRLSAVFSFSLVHRPYSSCADHSNFSEALRVTAKAKSGFPTNSDDLYDRGRKLIAQSIECGVTLMRAHVEVDETVHFACVDAGLRLRKLFRDICHVQVAGEAPSFFSSSAVVNGFCTPVFAQDPLFASATDDRPGLNYALLQSAIRRHGVEAIGSAPYVEPSIHHAKRNIDLIFDLAFEAGIHVDFHLDYNLEPSAEPLIWYVLEQLRQRIQSGRWRPGCQVCVGHATRLTLFSHEEWTAFRAAIVDERLPLTLVGLPPSDLYMMGRNLDYAPRGTLNVPKLATAYGLRVAMSVNNVENAFTPQGPVDPLSLCPLGVAVFQAGTKIDCRTLLVSLFVSRYLNLRAAASS